MAEIDLRPIASSSDAQDKFTALKAESSRTQVALETLKQIKASSSEKNLEHFISSDGRIAIALIKQTISRGIEDAYLYDLISREKIPLPEHLRFRPMRLITSPDRMFATVSLTGREGNMFLDLPATDSNSSFYHLSISTPWGIEGKKIRSVGEPAFSARQNRGFIPVDVDGALHLLDLYSRKVHSISGMEYKHFKGLHVSPDGVLAVAVTLKANTLTIHDLTTMRDWSVPNLSVEHAYSQATFSPNGDLDTISLRSGGSKCLLNLRTRELLKASNLPVTFSNAPVFSLDGTNALWLVQESGPTSPKLFNLRSQNFISFPQSDSFANSHIECCWGQPKTFGTAALLCPVTLRGPWLTDRAVINCSYLYPDQIILDLDGHRIESESLLKMAKAVAL